MTAYKNILILTLAFLCCAPLIQAQKIYNQPEELYQMQDEILTFVSQDKNDYYYVARVWDNENQIIKSNMLYRKRKTAGGTWSVENLQIPGLDLNQPFSIMGAGDGGNRLYVLNSFKGDNLLKSGVFYTEMRDGGWSPLYRSFVTGLRNMDPVFSGSVTNDERTMFLSLDDPRVPGKENLHISFFDEDEGKWSWPLRLNDNVNSINSDFSPYLSDDSKYLYFASDRPGGLGASDIYISERLDDSYLNWSTPENMGPGVNTAGSETYYTELDNNQFYLVQGDNSPENKFYNTLVLAFGDEGIDDLAIDDNAGQVYEDDLPTAADSDADMVFTNNNDSYDDDRRYPTLPSTTLGSSEVGDRYYEAYTGSEMVYFSLGSAQVTTAGQKRLAEVARIFHANPDMKIEITGYTCAVGDEKSNLRLSMKRASSVSKYLLALGVNSGQILTRGLGETDATGPDDLNRRAEVQYLAPNLPSGY